MNADVPAGVVLLIGVVRPCIDRPGEVTITNVEFEHLDDNLRVEAFATKPLVHPEWPDEDWPEWVDRDWESNYSELWELGFTPGAVGVDAVCYSEKDQRALERLRSPAARTEMLAESPPVAILGMQLVKETDATARGAIIKITYTSGGRRYTHRTGFELVLCGLEVDPEGEECDFRSGTHYGW
jgi:hypothetical protein